jgi:NAD(P)-dependent dehydrogenase (short-subunit alcohol dehydrogenase family)
MNQFACVTGADRGVGLELTRQLLSKGYTVFAGRFLKEVKLLDDFTQEYGEQLYIIELDISSDQSVKEAAEYIKSKIDKLDILINNGAILGDIDSTVLDELDFEEMQRVFNVTALGALRMSNALAPLILKSDTKLIVNISSEAGSISASYRKSWFGYSMAKAAVNMQSTIVHNQLKDLGGQVLVVHPGWVKTYMQGKLDEKATLTPEQSAEHIIKLALEHKKYNSDKPAYVDYLGTKMEW